jgi:glycosyltransferase involved in cell wall biosynthesis
VHTRRWVDPFVERGDEVWVLNVAPQPARRPWSGVRLMDLTAAINTPWLRYPVWTLHARTALRRIRPDLVHAHCLDLSGWVAAAAGYHPLVVTVWGSDIMLHPDRSRLARRLAGWVLTKADAVTAPAQPLYERAVSFAGSAERVHLIHWGVDCEVFRPEGETTALRVALDLPARAPVLFCPRALAPVYNIGTVLQALRRVLQARPDAYLLLVEFNARPDYRRKIDQWIQEWGLGDRVRFLPQMDGQADMAALYRLATVTITLPLSDSLSLTVLESMACGTPAVVSDLPAYEDWIVDGETGYRVPTKDAAAAAGAVLWLLDREEERQAFGSRGRRMVLQQASLAQQMGQSIELYETLVSGQPTLQRQRRQTEAS